MAKLDINTASLEELGNVNGIGERRARSIISHREAKDGFQSLDELTLLPYFEHLTVADREALEDQLEVRSVTIQVRQGGGKRRR